VQDVDMTEKEQFTVKYGGDLLDSGLMDVRELAPALLSLGDLLQQSNIILNGDRAHVSIQVRSQFKKGSFEVGLVLVQGVFDLAQEYLKMHPAIKDAKNILEIIFFYGGIPGTAIAGGCSLFRFIKRLRGRQIPKEGVIFQNHGIIQIIIPGDDPIQISRDVLNLANDPSIRKSIEGAIAPLNRNGIDFIEFCEGSDKCERVIKDDIQFYQAGEIGQELLIDNEREAVISIVRLSFKQEHKWSFTDGAARITALIDDQDFWTRIQAGQRFAKGDQLRVKIRTKTTRTPSGDLKSEYRISRVLEYIAKRYPHQINF
jgi:hypothetical protein